MIGTNEIAFTIAIATVIFLVYFLLNIFQTKSCNSNSEIEGISFFFIYKSIELIF